MSSNLVPRGFFGRALAEVSAGQELRQIDQRIEIERGKARLRTSREVGRIETVARVTETALVATAHISAVESLLLTQAPHAEQRLRHLADAGSAAMANIVLGIQREDF